MTGKLLIDGKDAYSRFGIYVGERGYNDLAAFPPLKRVSSNNWPDCDGDEFDLSAPVLDTRELTINFGFHGANGYSEGFIDLLSDKSYHIFEFGDLGRTYTLRMVSCSKYELVRNAGLINVKFADDFPVAEGYVYTEPLPIAEPQGYKMDGKDFAEYGIILQEGCKTEIEKPAEVKNNMLRNINKKPGAIYDGETVVYKPKEVKLRCAMLASDTEGFWRNYDALLYDLTKPGERTLYVADTCKTYPFYYKNCSVSNFFFGNKICLEFTLTLVFTGFTANSERSVLATEAEESIVSEYGGYLIDLKEL